MNVLRDDLDRAIPMHEGASPDVGGLLRAGHRARNRHRAVISSVGVLGLGLGAVGFVLVASPTASNPRDLGPSVADPATAATRQSVPGPALFDVCAPDAVPRLKVVKTGPDRQYVITFGDRSADWTSTPGLVVLEGDDHVAFRARCGDEEVWKFDFVEDSARVAGGFFTKALPRTTFEEWVADKARTPVCEGACGP